MNVICRRLCVSMILEIVIYLFLFGHGCDE